METDDSHSAVCAAPLTVYHGDRRQSQCCMCCSTDCVPWRQTVDRLGSHHPPLYRQQDWVTTCRRSNNINNNNDDDNNNSNDNNNNNRIQRRYSRFFTVSSQRRELSPTCTLKWPRRNRVQITCSTSSAYHVQVSCCVPLGTKGQLSYLV